MAEGYLFDLPLSFFQQAVVTDGKFDAEKAAAYGYSPAQYPAIREFLGLEEEAKPVQEED